MKKPTLACTLLLVVAAITTPSAQALPICFKWVQFCDGLQIDRAGLGGAQWYHYDCANNSPMDAKTGLLVEDPCCNLNPDQYCCKHPEVCNQGIVRSLAPNGPGDYYFVVDTPFDGNLDMNQGVYPFGGCWIPQLAYALQMGACTGLEDDHAKLSSIQ